MILGKDGFSVYTLGDLYTSTVKWLVLFNDSSDEQVLGCISKRAAEDKILFRRHPLHGDNLEVV